MSFYPLGHSIIYQSSPPPPPNYSSESLIQPSESLAFRPIDRRYFSRRSSIFSEIDRRTKHLPQPQKQDSQSLCKSYFKMEQHKPSFPLQFSQNKKYSHVTCKKIPLNARNASNPNSSAQPLCQSTTSRELGAPSTLQQDQIFKNCPGPIEGTQKLDRLCRNINKQSYDSGVFEKNQFNGILLQSHNGQLYKSVRINDHSTVIPYPQNPNSSSNDALLNLSHAGLARSQTAFANKKLEKKFSLSPVLNRDSCSKESMHSPPPARTNVVSSNNSLCSKTKKSGCYKLEFQTSPLTFKKTAPPRKISDDAIKIGRSSNNSYLSWQEYKDKKALAQPNKDTLRDCTTGCESYTRRLKQTYSSVRTVESLKKVYKGSSEKQDHASDNANTGGNEFSGGLRLSFRDSDNNTYRNSDNNNFRNSNNSDVSVGRKVFRREDFKIVKHLGKGKYGDVSLVIHKESGFVCAMKSLEKQLIRQENLMHQLIREIKIQTYTKHPNVAEMYGFFADSQYVYLLMEPCCDGHLRKHIEENGRKLPEEKAKPIIKQIVSGVQYLHRNEILHRDLKPENMLIHQGVIKLCDFGWSVHMNNSLRATFCGTPLYVSPDILKGDSYDFKIDIWSVGIIAYEILVGKIPFEINSEQDLIKIIIQQVRFPADCEISDFAKEFLSILLRKNPKERVDVEELLYHSFLK